MFGFNVCMHVLRRYVQTYTCMFICALVTEKLLNRFPTLFFSIHIRHGTVASYLY